MDRGWRQERRRPGRRRCDAADDRHGLDGRRGRDGRGGDGRSHDPVAENIRQVAKAKGQRPEEVTVTVLDRDRHGGLIAEIREIGARVFLITDGDVAGAIVAAAPRTEVDLLMGIGGTPEGVIAAAALRCLGGAMQGRLYPRNDDERRSLIEGGYDLERVLRTSDLVASDDCFFAATGITDGYLLQGVKYWPDGASTHSMVMRSR